MRWTKRIACNAVDMLEANGKKIPEAEWWRLGERIVKILFAEWLAERKQNRELEDEWRPITRHERETMRLRIWAEDVERILPHHMRYSKTWAKEQVRRVWRGERWWHEVAL